MPKRRLSGLLHPAAWSPSLSRNVISNWTATGSAIVYSLVITPIVVRALSTELYGIWSFLNALLAYSNLVYVGLGAALNRYVAQYKTVGDQSAVNRLVSVVLWIYSILGVLCLVALAILAPYVPRLMAHTTAPDARAAAVVTCVLLGVRVLTMFVGSAFAGVLIGEGRLDVYCLVSTGGTVLRFVAVPLLIGTHGANPLLTLALTVVGTSVLETVVLARLAFSVDPALSVRPCRPTPPELRYLYGFGVSAFLLQISGQLISYTDTTVIGVMLGAASVSLYALPLQIVEYARLAVAAISYAMVPHVTALHTRQQHDALRIDYLRTVRICCLVGTFLNVNLIFLGAPFLKVWVGSAFGDAAWRVLLYLGVAGCLQAFAVHAQLPFWSGMRLMRVPVAVLLTEALANLVLSVRMARSLGIDGVALATLIPAACCSFLVLPAYFSRKLGVRLAVLFRVSLLPSIAFAAATSVVYGLLGRVSTPASYAGIAARGMLSVPVLVLSIAWLFPADERAVVWAWPRTAWQRLASLRHGNPPPTAAGQAP